LNSGVADLAKRPLLFNLEIRVVNDKPFSLKFQF
jgi:hypothetical protein